MTSPPRPLPDDVLAALGQGDVIEAIKRLRAETGLGLKDAKDRIDQYRSGAGNGLAAFDIGADRPLPEEARAALEAGQVIEAIKRVRESTGMGLREAKERVDAHMARIPETGRVPTLQRDSGNGLAWFALGLLVLAGGGYLLLR